MVMLPVLFALCSILHTSIRVITYSLRVSGHQRTLLRNDRVQTLATDVALRNRGG